MLDPTQEQMAWVEWFIGCYLAAATITVILVWV